MRFRIVTMLVLSCFVLHAQAKDDLPMAQPESVQVLSVMVLSRMCTSGLQADKV